MLSTCWADYSMTENILSNHNDTKTCIQNIKYKNRNKTHKTRRQNIVNWHYYRKSEKLIVRQFTIPRHDTFRAKQTVKHYKYPQELIHWPTGDTGMAHSKQQKFHGIQNALLKVHYKNILSIDDFKNKRTKQLIALCVSSSCLCSNECQHPYC